MIKGEAFYPHCSHDGLWSCFIGATELSNSINKSLVELGGPAEAGLGIGGENQASIAGQIGAVERALEVGVGDASVERKGMNCRVHFAEKMRDQEVKSRRFSGLGAPKSVEERDTGITHVSSHCNFPHVQKHLNLKP